jgi:hypothetical protein
MGASQSTIESILVNMHKTTLPHEIKEQMDSNDIWFAKNHVEWRQQVIVVFNSLLIPNQMQLRSLEKNITEKLNSIILKQRGSLVFHCELPSIEKLKNMVNDEAGIRKLLKEITRCLFLDYEIFKYETYVDKLVDGIHVEIIDNIWTARPDENYRIGGRRRSVKGGRKGKSKKNVSKRYKKKGGASRRKK